jgi:hemoglobin-like flavoprotein
MNAGENADSVSILTSELSEKIGSKVESGNHFKELAMSRIYSEVAPSNEVLASMCKTLESKDTIASLKEDEGKIRRAFDSAIKAISSVGSDELDAKTIEAFSSAYQNIINIYSNLSIKIRKERLRLAHRGVMSVIAAIENSKKDTSLNDSAIEIEFAKVLAESTFDELMEDLPGVNPVDPENKDAVDVLKASCEEKPAVTED